MVVGAAIQTSSFSLGQLIGGRVITGIGNGLNTSTVPTWQSETTKSHKRGQMVMIEGALITGRSNSREACTERVSQRKNIYPHDLC